MALTVVAASVQKKLETDQNTANEESKKESEEHGHSVLAMGDLTADWQISNPAAYTFMDALKDEHATHAEKQPLSGNLGSNFGDLGPHATMASGSGDSHDPLSLKVGGVGETGMGMLAGGISGGLGSGLGASIPAGGSLVVVDDGASD